MYTLNFIDIYKYIAKELIVLIYPVITSRARALPIFVTGIGSVMRDENVHRPDGYCDHQLSLIVSGKGKFFCGGREFSLNPGTVFLFKKKVPHSYYLEDTDFCHRWITFDGHGIESFIDMLCPEGYAFFENTSLFDALCTAFSRIYAHFSENDISSDISASSILYCALLELFCTSHLKIDAPGGFVGRITAYIEKNYASDIALDDIAQELGISKFKLCRLFRRIFGTTIFSYISEYRIQKAKTYLSRGTLSVGQIAKLCGYNSESYFISCFKKNQGVTPLAFRENFLP